jgi:hypothetical protein
MEWTGNEIVQAGSGCVKIAEVFEDFPEYLKQIRRRSGQFPDIRLSH